MLESISKAIEIAKLHIKGDEFNSPNPAIATSWALIAIAEQLGRLNDSLDSVIGQTKSGDSKWIEVYDNKPSGEI